MGNVDDGCIILVTQVVVRCNPLRREYVLDGEEHGTPLYLYLYREILDNYISVYMKKHNRTHYLHSSPRLGKSHMNRQ